MSGIGVEPGDQRGQKLVSKASPPHPPVATRWPRGQPLHLPSPKGGVQAHEGQILWRADREDTQEGDLAPGTSQRACADGRANIFLQAA
jgi:hypothetical protein